MRFHIYFSECAKSLVHDFGNSCFFEVGSIWVFQATGVQGTIVQCLECIIDFGFVP